MAGRSRTDKFCLRVVFLLISTCLPIHGLEEFYGRCGLTIDLILAHGTYSGLLAMPLPQSMTRYQDPTHPIFCDVIITFASGSNLLIELYSLDIMPRSSDARICTTGLEVFDQTARKYYGSRICMEGWQWEERHREKQQEKHVVQNSPLTLRLVSEGPYRGEGFKIHFNLFRPSWPCLIQEFQCQQVQRCVHDHLTCDGWDDCGDFSDERIEAGCELLTASEICGLIMALLLFIGILTESVVFTVRYKSFYSKHELKSESRVPVVSDRYNMETVGGGAGHRYNSQDSLPSRYSKSTAPTKSRHESESDTVDKLDLEKADRLIARSGHYNDRKGRSSSQGSLKHDTVESISGTENPALQIEEDSLKRGRSQSQERISGRDRSQHSFDDDGRDDRDQRRKSYNNNSHDDSDRYKDQTRRNSRERSSERYVKRNRRYSDEDSDFDRDRERRRSRSYNKYSDDSDCERKRRRSRERYSRERSDDFSDSDRERYRERDDDTDVDRRRNYRSSHERDRKAYRNTYEDQRKSSYENNGDGRPVQQRRRNNERRSSSSAGRGWGEERYRDSPPLPLPPPYSEEDSQSLEEQMKRLPLSEKDVRIMNLQNKILASSSDSLAYIERQRQKQLIQELGETGGRMGTPYHRGRCMPQTGYQDSSPPRYQDIDLKPPAHVGITYKEDSV